MPIPTDELVELVLDALAEIKASDLKVLDVRRLTDVTDFMVVASGRSRRQVAAIAENVAVRAKAAGHRPMGVEGTGTAEWVLVDLCDVVVHVMQPQTRELYQLEKLWSGTREDPASGGARA